MGWWGPHFGSSLASLVSLLGGAFVNLSLPGGPKQVLSYSQIVATDDQYVNHKSKAEKLPSCLSPRVAVFLFLS